MQLWSLGETNGDMVESKPLASRTLQSQFPPAFRWLKSLCPPLLVEYYTILRFPISSLPPLWQSRFPPSSLFPLPVHFPPHSLPGSRALVPPPPMVYTGHPKFLAGQRGPIPISLSYCNSSPGVAVAGFPMGGGRGEGIVNEHW